MPKKKKQPKINVYQVDTSRAKQVPGYLKSKGLEVEKDINKDKEVREKDVFNFGYSKAYSK